MIDLTIMVFFVCQMYVIVSQLFMMNVIQETDVQHEDQVDKDLI